MYFMIFIYSSSKRVLVRILPCSHLIVDGKEWVASIPLESSIHVVDNLLLYQTEKNQPLPAVDFTVIGTFLKKNLGLNP